MLKVEHITTKGYHSRASPHFLMYGRDSIIPLETEPEDQIRFHHMDVDDYKHILIQELNDTYEKVRENASKEQQKYQKEFDKRNKTAERQYPKLGDRVLLKIPTEKGSSKHPKLTNEWKGPYRIINTSKNSVEIVPIIGGNEKLKVPYEQLKKIPSEFIDKPIETRKSRGRRKKNVGCIGTELENEVVVNNIYSSRNDGCGCSKCSVEMKWRGETVIIKSVWIAAGMLKAARLNPKMTREEALLCAQVTKVDANDQVPAIKMFARCPTIIEFLSKFDEWKVAVDQVKDHLKKLAKPAPIEIAEKKVILCSKMEKARVPYGQGTKTIYVKDNEWSGVFERFNFKNCQKMLILAPTKEVEGVYDDMAKMIEKRKENIEIDVYPLPMQCKWPQLNEVDKWFEKMGIGDKVRVTKPTTILHTNDIPLPAFYPGGFNITQKDFNEFLETLMKKTGDTITAQNWFDASRL